MRRLGVHTSIAGGLYKSLERAYAFGCNTVQLFSHNPREWIVKPVFEEDISRFKSLRSNLDISPVYVHASYLINIASRNDNLRRKSIDLLIIEMDRADAIGADYVILHMGSVSMDDKGASKRRATNALNEVAEMGEWRAGLLIENTVSSTIADLSEIVNSVKGPLVRGICIDTCHAFAAGYDISTDEGIKRISNEIKRFIGRDKLKLIHLNDSKGDIGSGIDRHEHIGLGKIGVSGLKQFINHHSFRYIPLILETPKKKESDDHRNLKKVSQMIRIK